MRATVDQAQFAQALTQASRLVNPQNTLPVLAGVEIQTTSTGLLVYSTDLTTFLTIAVPAQVSEPGRLAVSAQTLSELVRRIPLAHLEMVEQGGRLQVRYGRNRATLQTYGDQTLPEFPEVEGIRLTLPAGEFGDLNRELLFATSHDEMRSVLRGVALTYGHGRLVFQATDGTRFSHRWLPVPDVLDDPVTIVVPAKAMTEGARLWPDTAVTMTLGSKLAQFEAQDMVLATRLLEGTYPDLSHAAPETYIVTCRVSTNDLRGGLERVHLITAKEHMASVKLHTLPGQGVELTASSQDVGSLSEVVDCVCEGQELEILFNPQYLIEGVRSFSDPDVIFELSGMQSAARIRGTDDSTYFHAVLPMRQLV